MKARDIMTTDVITARPDTSVHDAAALLSEHGITSLPVVDEEDRLIGMVSEIDLLRGRLPHDPTAHARRDLDLDAEQPDPPRTVGQVMNDIAICVGRDTDTADLAEIMLDNRIRAVPIVDGARVVGIVSRRDLLRTLLRDDALIAQDVQHRLDEYADEPGRWTVAVRDGVVHIDGHFDDVRQHDVATLLVRTVPGVVRVHTHRSRLGLHR